MTDAGKSVVLGVVDDDSTSGAEFTRERGLKSVGVWCDSQALSFEKSDDIVMGMELFIAEFWVLVDLRDGQLSYVG